MVGFWYSSVVGLRQKLECTQECPTAVLACFDLVCLCCCHTCWHARAIACHVGAAGGPLTAFLLFLVWWLCVLQSLV